MTETCPYSMGVVNALVDHLWQSTAVFLMVWVLALSLRNHRAAVRYGLWLLASVKFLVPFSALVVLGRQLPMAHTHAAAQRHVGALLLRSMQPYGQPTLILPLEDGSNRPHTGSGWWTCLLCVWALGAFLLALHWIRTYLGLRRLARASETCGMLQGVEVKRIAARTEPGVFGWWRPVLLMPGVLLDALPPAELEAIYAHELCHVRRHDNLLAAVHHLVVMLFWFHPAVWWLRARLLEERERACDETVVGLGSNAEVYAQSLLHVCRWQLEEPTAVMAGLSGGELKDRVLRIVSETVCTPLSGRRKALLGLVAVSIAAAPLATGLLNGRPVRAQAEAHTPAFEVASIRPDAKAVGMSSGTEGSTYTCRGCSVIWMLMGAFDLKQFQIAGGPHWVSEEHYTVEGKLPPEVLQLPQEERWKKVGPMLQTLLAERYRLRFHWIEQVHPVYALVTTGKGAKLSPAKPEEQGYLSIGPGFFDLRAMSMETLTNNLGFNLDAIVQDKTGLQGNYTVSLHFAAPEGEDQSPTANELSAPEAQARLFSALEEAGLKLVAEKRPVKILVIDSIDRPTPN